MHLRELYHHGEYESYLLERLAGRPFVRLGVPMLQDGGRGKLVGLGGLPFTGTGCILPQPARLVANLDAFRSGMLLPTIDEIAAQYISLARRLVNDV